MQSARSDAAWVAAEDQQPDDGLHAGDGRGLAEHDQQSSGEPPQRERDSNGGRMSGTHRADEGAERHTGGGRHKQGGWAGRTRRAHGGDAHGQRARGGHRTVRGMSRRCSDHKRQADSECCSGRTSWRQPGPVEGQGAADACR